MRAAKRFRALVGDVFKGDIPVLQLYRLHVRTMLVAQDSALVPIHRRTLSLLKFA
jgi:hypothetical protein